MTAEIVISDLGSFRSWRAAVRNAPLPSRLPPVEFDLPRFSGGRNRQLTREAMLLQRACGCTSGGLAMIAALLLIALSLANAEASLRAIPLLVWLEYLLVVAATGAAGKLAGLFWARWRMVRLADAIGSMIGEEALRPAH